MREKRYSLQNAMFYDAQIDITRPRTSIYIQDFGKVLGHESSPGKERSLSRCDSIDQDLLAAAHKRLKSCQQQSNGPSMKLQFGREDLPATIPPPTNPACLTVTNKGKTTSASHKAQKNYSRFLKDYARIAAQS